MRQERSTFFLTLDKAADYFIYEDEYKIYGLVPEAASLLDMIQHEYPQLTDYVIFDLIEKKSKTKSKKKIKVTNE